MIETDSEGDYRTIRFDRPEARNALTPDALDDIEAALDAATESVVLLEGAGEAFCAGADLTLVDELDAHRARELAARGQEVAQTLETYDGVVIAGIDGPARGGGVELALACDLRIATADATFAESGIDHGIFGAWGGTVRLPRLVGESVAMALSLSGRVIDASEARQIGLVSRLVENPRTVAEALAEKDAEALQSIKRRIRDRDSLAVQEEREREAFAALVDSQ